MLEMCLLFPSPRNSGQLVVTVSSLARPSAAFAVNLEQVVQASPPSLPAQPIARMEVPLGFDQEEWMTELLLAPSEGAFVPISVLRCAYTSHLPCAERISGRPSLSSRKCQKQPVVIFRRRSEAWVERACVLYGYGAYGAVVEPTFDPDRLPLLRRGVAYAMAHVRGGGELGAGWHAQGSRLRKLAGVGDFLCAAAHLQAAAGGALRLAAEGRSAGGYLVGAALNSARGRQLFSAALLEASAVAMLQSFLGSF